MAKLSAFRVDSRAADEGAWLSPGDEYDDLEIKTRAMGDRYSDALTAKRRRAAVSLGGDTSKIPAAVARALLVDSLIDHCLQDVRGLSDDSGKPVDFAAFCALLRDPAYPDLLVAAIRAATAAGNVRAAVTEEAAGN